MSEKTALDRLLELAKDSSTTCIWSRFGWRLEYAGTVVSHLGRHLSYETVRASRRLLAARGYLEEAS
jgi:hypothetical protein